MGLTAIEGGKKSEKMKMGSLEWSVQIRKETKALSRNIDYEYLRLAQNLWLLFDTPVDGDPKNTCWLTKWEYGHIGEYAEKELGISKRIADRLRRMWKVIGLDCKDVIDDEYTERFIGIGRSKARLITRPLVMNNKNARSWIERAEQLTYLALEEEVNTYLSGRAGVMKGTLGGVEPVDPEGDVIEDDDSDAPVPPPPSKSMAQLIADGVVEQVAETKGTPAVQESEVEKLHYKNFALFPDQWDTVKAALERASELSGSKKDGQNLSLMALDFLATNEFKKASMEQTQRFFKRIEKALTVKIIVMAPKDFEVLYGYKTLEKINNMK